MLTTREAAEVYRVVPATILAWRKRKLIAPCGRTGKGWLWELATLEKYVKRAQDEERVAALMRRRIA